MTRRINIAQLAADGFTINSAELIALGERCVRLEEALQELNEIIELCAGRTISPTTTADLQAVLADVPEENQ